MAREIVIFKSFDGRDGLLERRDDVLAYVGERVVAAAEKPPETSLEDLAYTYRVLELFPDLVFCYTRPTRTELAIDIWSRHDRQLDGMMLYNGVMLPWQVRWMRDPIFDLADELPAGQRSWVRKEDGGWGLRFHLPGAVHDQGDPVVMRRTALALEEFVYALRDRYDVDLPYRREFMNLFSLDMPTWRVNLPFIHPTPLT